MNSYDYLINEATQKGIDLGIEKGIDLGIEKGIDLGIEKGIDLGAIKTQREVIKNILTQFSDWADEKIADLATSTVDMVKSVRAELAQ